MRNYVLLSGRALIILLMLLACSLRGQESQERLHTDLIIQQYCGICQKEKKINSSLENLFHDAHTLGLKQDNERLILIMNAIDLARSSKDQRMLFFCTS